MDSVTLNVATAAELADPAIELGSEPADPDFQTYMQRSLKGAEDELMLAAMADLRALYPQFDGGKDRAVFDGGEVVYKVGNWATQKKELDAYQRPETIDYLPVAPCRLVYHANGTPILIMETVRPATHEDDVPRWATRVDCTQVGLNKDYQWVIFDAGDDLYCEVEASGDEDYLDHDTPLIFL